MDTLGWMLVGVLVGALAHIVLPRRAANGSVVLMLIGIAGAMLAPLLGRAFGVFAGNSLLAYAAAAAGAAALLVVYQITLRYRAGA